MQKATRLVLHATTSPATLMTKLSLSRVHCSSQSALLMTGVESNSVLSSSLDKTISLVSLSLEEAMSLFLSSLH